MNIKKGAEARKDSSARGLRKDSIEYGCGAKEDAEWCAGRKAEAYLLFFQGRPT
jgi:hypothetical protein